jgi:hypothetical protein
VTDLDVPKRPKLENHLSADSSVSTSSSASLHGRDTPTGHLHADSSSPSTSQWHPHESHLSTVLTLPIMQAGTGRGSPSSPSSMLSGYHGPVYAGSSQSLPWREGNREEHSMPLQQRRRVSSIGDRPAGYPGPPMGDPLRLTEAMQPARRMGPVPHPPSTSASVSSHSTSSSAFLTPRTPMERPLERALSITSLYPRKSPGNYDNQLPPLRSLSLSPQSRAHGPQHSPSSMLRLGNIPYDT